MARGVGYVGVSCLSLDSGVMFIAVKRAMPIVVTGLLVGRTTVVIGRVALRGPVENCGGSYAIMSAIRPETAAPAVQPAP